MKSNFLRRTMQTVLLTSSVVWGAAEAVTVAGTNPGAIPDGPTTCTGTATGAPRILSFNVTGIVAVTEGVSINFTATHTHVGDLRFTLAAPGGSPSADLFGNTGTIAMGSLGDSSNLSGVYTFDDFQPGNWWAAAAANTSTAHVVPPGGYRSSNYGAATQTLLDPVFAGLTPAQANGAWTLRVSDDCGADTGSITAANLSVDEAVDPFFTNGFENAPPTP